MQLVNNFKHYLEASEKHNDGTFERDAFFYLKAQTEDDEEQGDEGSQEAEENILPDSVEHSEV